jgi:hypothetical protein
LVVEGTVAAIEGVVVSVDVVCGLDIGCDMFISLFFDTRRRVSLWEVRRLLVFASSDMGAPYHIGEYCA